MVTFTKGILNGKLAILCSVKSLSETRWACRFEGTRTVEKQLVRFIEMLVFFVRDKYLDAKTSSDARCLLGAICTFNVSFIVRVLKFILSNTNELCTFF